MSFIVDIDKTPQEKLCLPDISSVCIRSLSAQNVWVLVDLFCDLTTVAFLESTEELWEITTRRWRFDWIVQKGFEHRLSRRVQPCKLEYLVGLVTFARRFHNIRKKCKSLKPDGTSDVCDVGDQHSRLVSIHWKNAGDAFYCYLSRKNKICYGVVRFVPRSLFAMLSLKMNSQRWNHSYPVLPSGLCSVVISPLAPESNFRPFSFFAMLIFLHGPCWRICLFAHASVDESWWHSRMLRCWAG